jgi:hypothetical protein
MRTHNRRNIAGLTPPSTLPPFLDKLQHSMDDTFPLFMLPDKPLKCRHICRLNGAQQNDRQRTQQG